MKRILYIFIIILLSFAFEKNTLAAVNDTQCKGIEMAGGGQSQCEAEPNCKYSNSLGCYYVDPALNTDQGKIESESLNCGQYTSKESCNAVNKCYFDDYMKKCIYNTVVQKTTPTSSDNNGEEYIDPSNCGVLGGFKEDLQNILKAIRIVAPVLVVFLSAYEYLTVVFMKSADDLKKANKRLINRLILIALLFFLPTLLNLILSLIETGDYTTCIN